MNTKFCKKCDRERPFSDFGDDPRTKDGKKSSCRVHSKEDSKRWRDSHQNHIKAYRQAIKKDIDQSELDQSDTV